MLMRRRATRWRLLAGALVLGLSTTACAQLSPTTLIPRLNGSSDSSDPVLSDTAPDGTGASTRLSAQTDPNATPVAGAAAVATALPAGQAAVTRGSIEDTLSATGRVAGVGETDVAFNGSGKVDIVAVKPGDKVEAGQLLLQTDAQQITKDLNAARTALDNDAARVQQALDQSQSQAHAQQLDAAKRAADDEQRRQQAIQDAQNGLRQAQDNYAKVAAGPSSTDIRTAQTTLANAQATLTKATADRDKLQSGPDPTAVRNAQTTLANAQSDVDKAQADLNKLTNGPDPDAVRAAERDVARAQTTLQVAQATKVDKVNVTQAQHDALVANAQLNVQDAQDKLNQLKQPPSASDVAIAQRNLQIAKSAADAAKQNLDTIKQGADQATIDAANQAVDNAQALVDNAQDRLDELQSHPTPQELRDAQARVDAAKTALTNAQKPVSANTPVDDGSTAFNIQLLQKAVAQDQSNVDTLQKQLDDAKLLSPAAGVVTAVQAHAGDTVDPTRPIVTLAQSGAPVIAVDLTDQDGAKVAVGQVAHIKLGGVGNPIDATVKSLASNQAAGVGKTALLSVTWPGDPPAIGTAADVALVTQHKDNVLLVPKKAVRSAGSRKFVQYVSGTSHKVANVEVGITSGDMVEIVSGLTEGQVIIVGP